MPYVYEEGAVPVPAHCCTRCGGLLEKVQAPVGDLAGFFEPSTLDESTWVFLSGRDAPEDDTPEHLACKPCGISFALYRTAQSHKHPGG